MYLQYSIYNKIHICRPISYKQYEIEPEDLFTAVLIIQRNWETLLVDEGFLLIQCFIYKRLMSRPDGSKNTMTYWFI